MTTPNAQIVRVFASPDGVPMVAVVLLNDRNRVEFEVPRYAVMHDDRDGWFYSPGKHVFVHKEAIRHARPAH